MVFIERQLSDGLHTRRRNASDANLDMEMEVSLSTHSTIVESTPPTTMSIYYLVMLNAIVCGLEFCASAGFCYIPPMLLKAGISEQSMSLILGLGPTLGFFLVPVIGRSSDNCRSQFGRRRPFIFILSMLLIVALFIIPFGGSFCNALLGSASELKTPVALATMIIGAVMLDFTSQACLTPCEALLSDLSRGTTQHSRCFTVYSFMVSIGGCVGYLVTGVDWSANPVGVYLGGQEHSVFVVLIVLFSFSFLMTFGAAVEIPLTTSDSVNPSLSLEDVASRGDDDLFSSRRCDVESNGTAGRKFGLLTVHASLDAVLSSRRKILGPVTSLLCCFVRWLRLSSPFRNLSNVPLVLRRLALSNFCSWTAVMSFNIFFSDFVGQAVYGGNPGSPEGSESRELYDRGVRVGSLGLLLHCINSAAYASFIERIMARYDLRLTYVLGMSTFTVSMLLMAVSQNVYLVSFMAAMTGVGYATLTTTPFMLITVYHEDEKLYFFDTGDGVTTPARGLGTDFATLDSAYYLSQVILTAFMGTIVHLTGTVLSYVVVAGLVGLVSCFCATRIIVNKTQMQALIKSHGIVKTC